MILNLNDAKFVNSLVGYDMAYCFNHACSRAGSCFRHIAAKFKPSNKTSGHAIYPDALQDGDCRYFIRPRIIKAAWGFGSLYDAVKYNDVTNMRCKVMSILGGKTSYYRYHRGEKLLSPELQQAIQKEFETRGYHSPSFDHYKETIDFTDKENDMSSTR